MTAHHDFLLSGLARPAHVDAMLDEICEHFVEHADVHRDLGMATLHSDDWTIEIAREDDLLRIALGCDSEEELEATRTMFAEHLYYFAGDEPFSLDWARPAPQITPANLQEVTVVSTAVITPKMRRVTFACTDVKPFLDHHMHVRLLVPPRGRKPRWPALKEDGRIGWPTGEDALVVRIYTIRSVDAEKGHVSIDFLQHPAEGIATPGADFARDAKPGDRVALMGPGGGGLPDAERIFLAGDESALPAIARMAEEAPAGVTLQAIIEVEDAAEEQVFQTAANLSVRWLHRSAYAAEDAGVLRREACAAVEGLDDDSFVWFACEKDDVRAFKAHLAARGRNRRKQYCAWYWERGAAATTD